MAYRTTALTEQRRLQAFESILKSARALVSEGGFRQLSIQAVASHADMATGSIYRHFDSKTALCIALFQHATEHEMAQVQEAARSQGSYRLKLHNALSVFAERALQNPTFAYAMIAEPVGPELDEARLEYRKAWAGAFVQLIRNGIRQGEFVPQPEALCAAAMVGAMAEALIAPGTQQLPVAKRKKQIQHLVQFCLRAVLKPESDHA